MLGCKCRFQRSITTSEIRRHLNSSCTHIMQFATFFVLLLFIIPSCANPVPVDDDDQDELFDPNYESRVLPPNLADKIANRVYPASVAMIMLVLVAPILVFVLLIATLIVGAIILHKRRKAAKQMYPEAPEGDDDEEEEEEGSHPSQKDQQQQVTEEQPPMDVQTTFDSAIANPQYSVNNNAMPMQETAAAAADPSPIEPSATPENSPEDPIGVQM